MRILLALALLLSACSTPPPSPPTKELRISFRAQPPTFDPRKSSDFLSATCIAMLFEGLTRCAPDGTAEFALAERIDCSPDHLVYTFHLRPSFWSDGMPVTARDFELAWKKILDPSFGSPSAYLFYPIKNAKLASLGYVSPEDVGIHSLDDFCLEVVLERPTPYFLSLTSFPSFLPIPTHRNEQQQQTEIVSNGPFILDPRNVPTELTLKKNSTYWNKSAISLNAIRIAIVANETTALQLFEQGDLDVLGGACAPLPLDASTELLQRYTLQFHPMSASTFCAFQVHHPALKNKLLRKALSAAINRPLIVEQITQRGEESATRCVPPSLVSSQNKILYPPYDPDQARCYFQQALNELGLSKKQLPQLCLSYRAVQVDKQIAQALQSQWNEVLGIEINLQQIEPHCFRQHLEQREFDLALSFWIAQYSDPMNILERFASANNSKNIPGWEDPTFSALLDRAQETLDPLARSLFLERAEELMMEEMPLAPIYHWSNPTISNPRVHNLQFTPNGGILFERCSV